MSKITYNSRGVPINLTSKQLYALRSLTFGPQTTNNIAVKIPATVDAAQKNLRRLEDRELVRRIGSKPTKWELTDKGRDLIA